MKKRVLATLVCACAIACNSTPKARPTGGVQLLVSTDTNGSGVTIQCVRVTVSGDWTNPPSAPPIVHQLVKVSDEIWQGTLFQVPVSGVNKNHFQADAFTNTDCSGIAPYSGQDDEFVTANTTAAVAISITLPPSPATFGNHAPDIGSISASNIAPGVGDLVTVTANASDPDPGDTLTYTWDVQGPPGSGTFTLNNPLPSLAAFTGNVQGTFVITVTVADNHGAADQASITIAVGPGLGSATVRVTFNVGDGPVITSMFASDVTTSAPAGHIAPGTSVNVGATVTAPEGDGLTYQWAIGACSAPASIGDAQQLNGILTIDPSAPVNTTCEVTLTVTDGLGAVANGSLVLTVQGPAPVLIAPQVVQAFQSFLSADAEQVVNFDITAFDPQGNPMNITWQNPGGGGTLGDATSGAPGASAVTYTPDGSVCGRNVVEVDVFDTVTTATTSYQFSVSVICG